MSRKPTWSLPHLRTQARIAFAQDAENRYCTRRSAPGRMIRARKTASGDTIRPAWAGVSLMITKTFDLIKTRWIGFVRQHLRTDKRSEAACRLFGVFWGVKKPALAGNCEESHLAPTSRIQREAGTPGRRDRPPATCPPKLQSDGRQA